MPEGTDLLDFSPRVGAAGDDRYDPGEVKIRAGDSSGFSDPPTLAEVALSSDWNQARGEINRQYHLYATGITGIAGGGGTFPNGAGAPNYATAKLTYLVEGERIKATHVSEMRTLIDTLRAAQGRAAFSWSFSVPLDGKKIRRLHFLELRKALAIDHYPVSPNLNAYAYTGFLGQKFGALWRTGTTYPPITTTTLTADEAVGQDKSGATYYKKRTYAFYKIPGAAISPASAKASIYTLSEAGSAALRMYRSNSHLAPLGTGDWGNLDNLEWEENFTSFVNGTRVEISMAGFAAISPGSSYTYIFVTDRDVGDNAPSGAEEISVGQSASNLPILRLYTA